MDSYYLKDDRLVHLATHKTLAGAKGWASKYALWGGNGKCDLYIKSNDGLVLAMRIAGRWVCPETDARRRARLDA